MKADIDEFGCLTVSAETALESYALAQWHKGWNKPFVEADSVLMIEVPVENSPGMTTRERAMPATDAPNAIELMGEPRSGESSD